MKKAMGMGKTMMLTLIDSYLNKGRRSSRVAEEVVARRNLRKRNLIRILNSQRLKKVMKSENCTQSLCCPLKLTNSLNKKYNGFSR
jgi:hypothetical protein